MQLRGQHFLRTAVREAAATAAAQRSAGNRMLAPISLFLFGPSAQRRLGVFILLHVHEALAAERRQSVGSAISSSRRRPRSPRPSVVPPLFFEDSSVRGPSECRLPLPNARLSAASRKLPVPRRNLGQSAFLVFFSGLLFLLSYRSWRSPSKEPLSISSVLFTARPLSLTAEMADRERIERVPPLWSQKCWKISLAAFDGRRTLMYQKARRENSNKKQRKKTEKRRCS